MVQSEYSGNKENHSSRPAGGDETYLLGLPATPPASREDCDEFFDFIAMLANCAHDCDLLDLAHALELALDACLIERERAIPERNIRPLKVKVTGGKNPEDVRSIEAHNGAGGMAIKTSVGFPMKNRN